MNIMNDCYVETQNRYLTKMSKKKLKAKLKFHNYCCCCFFNRIKYIVSNIM
jgi:hypothetical protein